MLASRRSQVSIEKIVGGMMFRVEGNVFELRDRQIFAEYRQQGFGSMALDCSEAYIQERSNETQEEQLIKVNVAQLDVICWLWNKGYRPVDEESSLGLEKVLEGDSKLRLGENLYIFDEKVPEKERTADHLGMQKALRIQFEKKIAPKSSIKVQDIQKKTADQIEGLIG